MSTRVARLCQRCHRYRPIAACWVIADQMGYRGVVCHDCLERTDRRIRGAA